MRRRVFLKLLGGTVTVAPASAQAQPTAKIARIGLLSSFSADRDRSYVEGLEQGLAELGYQMNRNLVIDQRYAAGQLERLPTLLAELLERRIDVLIAAGAPAALAAKQARLSLPVVFPNVADPVGVGLVDSLGRPGGNITGLSSFNVGLATKRIELIREAVPSAHRFAVLFNPDNPTNAPQLTLLVDNAPALKANVVGFEVRHPEEIERAFAAMAAQRAEALVVIDDPLLSSHAGRIADLAIKNGLPSAYASGPWAAAGGLMSYGANVRDLYRRAAAYVDKLLKGAKPRDLPIEQPTKFELAVNLKTARALGIAVPLTILLRADEVIE
jgi:putative ABC transport system substrate-binding protein